MHIISKASNTTTGLKSTNGFDFLASADGILGVHCTGEFSDQYPKDRQEKKLFSRRVKTLKPVLFT